MGNVFRGVPTELSLRLRDACQIKVFIETGTWRGGTAAWASDHFDRVYTIEGWPDFWKRARSTYVSKSNVDFILGDSRVHLPKVLDKLREPALIWLDAHYLGDDMKSAGTAGECPIREELKAIGSCGIRHYILIDDLHYFQGYLNPGGVSAQWPSVEEVHKIILAMLPDYFVADYEDVIIAVPLDGRKVVEEYMDFPSLRWVVSTSNKYVHLLNAFSYLFNKYVGNRQVVDVIRYDVRPPKLPANIHNTAIGYQASFTWTEGIATYLKLPSTPRHFVFLLEDYWITAPVDLERLNVLWKYAQVHPEVGKIDLSGDRMKTPYEDWPDCDLVISAQNAPFRASLQAAIWSRDYLLQCCERGAWSPWVFEKKGALRDGATVLGVKDPVILYVNAVGGEGHSPGEYDHKKIPSELWDELKEVRMVA